jgi:hypothetical protein
MFKEHHKNKVRNMWFLSSEKLQMCKKEHNTYQRNSTQYSANDDTS